MQIDVVLERMPPVPELETLWRELESRADTTFYTTWSWMGNWLRVLPPNMMPGLLAARRGGRLIGLGLMVKGKALLLRSIPVKCWRLHATGIEDIDELAIEYNGFLVDRDHAVPVKQAMLHFLLYSTGVKRLEMSRAESQYDQLAQRLPKDVLVRSVPATSYLVDLEQARAVPGGFLSLLSTNTRSQLRRSMGAYQALGTLALRQASSVDEARAFLVRLKALHGQTWAERGVRSGFSHGLTAARFHDSLIEQGLARGEIQVLRIDAGDTEVGYLYNFVHRGRVIFYQSGLNYGLLDKHDRPGLVCHGMAIEHNMRLGHRRYDFAAGDYRYKASLSTLREPQSTLVFQRDGVLPRLDLLLREWKREGRRMMREWHLLQGEHREHPALPG
jgi:CelD/BcsL family acetyltransferase involved in cellulose biosynthesis